jgi:hypothetical protein
VTERGGYHKAFRNCRVRALRQDANVCSKRNGVSVLKRFAEVGGIVRHVFHENYEELLTGQQNRVNELSLELLVDRGLAKAERGK